MKALEPDSGGLLRALGKWDLAFFLVGTVIGSGIFIRFGEGVGVHRDAMVGGVPLPSTAAVDCVDACADDWATVLSLPPPPLKIQFTPPAAPT